LVVVEGQCEFGFFKTMLADLCTVRGIDLHLRVIGKGNSKGGLKFRTFAQVCEEMSVDGTCAKYDKAYGGSFGFQGSVGLAIRAERIDSDAATSMRSSGLMHAGFYAELQYAKVDGFGSDSKLSVGDNTWFAGVDFEF
jgi:hypothetical protein